jgi:hypothetical protein
MKTTQNFLYHSLEMIQNNFVDLLKDEDHGYNNDGFYRGSSQRLRYLLATTELFGAKDEVQNKFHGCITFGNRGNFKVHNPALLDELMSATYDDLEAYVDDNGFDWLGDDYEHIDQYLDFLNNYQDKLKFSSDNWDDPDAMDIHREEREWITSGEHKSENPHEVAYNILMDHFDELPEETRLELDEKLSKINL